MHRQLAQPWDGTVLVMEQSRYDKANNTLGSVGAQELIMECAPHAILVTPDEPLKSSQGIKRIVYCGNTPSLARTGRSLDQMRGFVDHSFVGCPCIHTYHPQDAMDITAQEFYDDEDDDAGESDEYKSKTKSATARRNYRFWFKRDVAKIYNPPPNITDTVHTIVDYAMMQNLAKLKTDVIYFDIETSVDGTNTLWCIGFAFENSPVYVLPVYNWKRELFEGINTRKSLAIFAQMLRTKRQVAHNADFDLAFLWLFCGIAPGPRLEDTMVMHHRLFPTVEKSLAHCITLYINAPYHKDTAGTFSPTEPDQFFRLCKYNASDVHRTRAIHQRMEALGALTLPQVQQGVQLHPIMLVSGLRGIRMNVIKLLNLRAKLKVQIEHANRVLRILAGYPINAGSAQECAKYCTRMGYALTRTTDSGAPAMDYAAVLRLFVQYKNPALQTILFLKDKQKQLSMLEIQLCQST